jgi:hypothetical protein
MANNQHSNPRVGDAKEAVMAQTEMNGLRFDGTAISRKALGGCDVAGCEAVAYSENCNAEGDEHRMHWHGTLHVRSKRFGSGQLCPVHAEEARQEWRTKRRQPANS